LQLSAAGRKLERSPAAFPRISGAAFWLMCSSLSEESGRGAHWSSCRRESTDAERGIESSGFLKSSSGKAPEISVR
jgi:hypothetical protein